MLQAANSAFYSPQTLDKNRIPGHQLRGYRGCPPNPATSAVQPLVLFARLRRIWKHAVEAAQVAEQIATMSKTVDPAEAFLLGLLHDVGKLAVALMPAS